MRTERPGFLVYYSIIDSLQEFTSEEKGVFLQAMCNYAREGTTPEFEDRGLRVLWRVAQNTLDKDAISYQDKCVKNKYNAYVSVQKRSFKKENPGEGTPIEGRDYLSFEDWLSQEDEEANTSDRQRPLTTVSEAERKGTNYNTNSNSNSNTNSNTNSNSNSNRQDVFAEFAGDDAELLQALRAFEEMRRRIRKPLSGRAKELALSKLETFQREQWVSILNQSVFNSWQGLFPLKEKETGRTTNPFLQMIQDGEA